MDQDILTFLRALSREPLTHVDRAVALIWRASRTGSRDGLRVKQICEAFETAGYPKQNVTRLTRGLQQDARTRKLTDGRYGISVTNEAELEAQFEHLDTNPQPQRSNSILPLELFVNTRSYLERVALQINASYDGGLYDCTAVMSRRLIETLIIEVYEHANRANELKGPDGHYMFLSRLVSHLQADVTLKLGRESTKGLKKFKHLGDQSAHNRRFNARKDDIDQVRDGLRFATEELLHLAGLT